MNLERWAGALGASAVTFDALKQPYGRLPDILYDKLFRCGPRGLLGSVDAAVLEHFCG
jgi:hypothetical protein